MSSNYRWMLYKYRQQQKLIAICTTTDWPLHVAGGNVSTCSWEMRLHADYV